MKYVFDSDSLINLFRHYYPKTFTTLWEKFDALVDEERLVSVREVFNEISSTEDSLATWAKEQKDKLFSASTPEELKFVSKIFQVNHFQAMIRKQEILQGKPIADPFVIARAKISDACVITEEKKYNKRSENPQRLQSLWGILR